MHLKELYSFLCNVFNLKNNTFSKPICQILFYIVSLTDLELKKLKNPHLKNQGEKIIRHTLLEYSANYYSTSFIRKKRGKEP